MKEFFFVLADYYATSTPVALFSVSIFLLFVSLIGLAWVRAIRLSFLDGVSLNSVEVAHPHLPSIHFIRSQCVWFLCLLGAVAVLKLHLDIPQIFIMQMGPLIILLAIILAGELWFWSERAYGVALSLGSCAGVALAALLGHTTGSDLLFSLFLCGAAMLPFLQRRQRAVMQHSWPWIAHTALICSAILWCVFLLVS